MFKKKYLLFFSLFILGVLLITSCLLKPPATEGILKGQVMVPEGSKQTKELTGQALSDATVNIIDLSTGYIIATTTTDANGYYRVFVPAGGPYLLEAVKDGIKVQQFTPQVEAGIEYDLGTADCATTAVALIAQAMMDAEDYPNNPADINLVDIEADPDFNEVMSIVCSIIEAGEDPAVLAVVQQAVEDFLHPPTPTPLSDAKAITAFGFAALDPDVVGVINEKAKTIALTVPFGTDVTALVPTIVHTGASVSPASGAAQDFTSPVNYTVTAEDTSTQAYVVTVTVVAAAPITITAIGAISGTAQVGAELTAGALTPAGATATYQWTICGTVDGTYTNITGATGSTYTAVADDFGKYIKVVATGTGSYSGTVTSVATAAVAAATAQATPTFSQVAGAVAFGTTVTIISAGADAIYYTTDDSDPTTASTNQATTPLVINAGVTVKALAVKAGYTDSAIGSAAYTQAVSADLTGLALSGTPGNYTFASGTYTYNSVTVANAVASITVTPTGAGVITVDGNTVVTGVASGAIALVAGVEKTIVVVATETGKTAKTYTIKVTRSLAIGNSYGGGKVAYIDGTGLHGLIAALSDQGSSTWGCYGTAISGADGTAIGTGHQNTHDMITAGCTNAAQLCHGVTINGYSDWYLPSKDELNKLWVNRAKIGGFSSVQYWSSSEYNARNAWYQTFSNSYQSTYSSKSNSRRVRAVRAF
jgi:hypothetical protein